MNITRVSTSDLPAAAATLACAFYDDPVWSWVFPDPVSRLQRLTALWGLMLAGSAEYQWTWMTGGCAAVTLWIPPGMPELATPYASEVDPLILELEGPRAPLVNEVFQRFEAAHPQVEGHYYLSLLGTHPDHRGAGLGMGLLEENLARIDREGVPAYLESSNSANLERYEAVGFRRLGSFQLPDDGPVVTTMWREPHPPRAP